MKKTASAVIGLGIAIGFAPAAHADEVSFVRDMNDAGFYNSNGYRAEVAVGMRVCEALLDGDTNYNQAHQLYLNSDITSMVDAEQFVHLAVKDLCP